MKLLSFKKKEKTPIDKQIDEMQISIAKELERAMRQLDSAIEILIKDKLTKEQKVSIYNNIQHGKFIIKNLASDLKHDARL